MKHVRCKQIRKIRRCLEYNYILYNALDQDIRRGYVVQITIRENILIILTFQTNNKI